MEHAGVLQELGDLNELLHDESIANANDVKFPESDHAPVIAEFAFPNGGGEKLTLT